MIDRFYNYDVIEKCDIEINDTKQDEMGKGSFSLLSFIYLGEDQGIDNENVIYMDDLLR